MLPQDQPHPPATNDKFWVPVCTALTSLRS